MKNLSELLENKRRNIVKLISDIKNCDFMEYYEFDNEGNKKLIQLDIPEGLKEDVLEKLFELNSNDMLSNVIYEDEQLIENVKAYFDWEGQEAKLVVMYDAGVKSHDSFSTPGQILYAYNEINKQINKKHK